MVECCCFIVVLVEISNNTALKDCLPLDAHCYHNVEKVCQTIVKKNAKYSQNMNIGTIDISNQSCRYQEAYY